MKFILPSKIAFGDSYFAATILKTAIKSSGGGFEVLSQPL
jgi:hypothetical protein